jgi:tetratricopeptide (TPR) repeat protein
MKNILLLSTALIGFAALRAQTIEEGSKQLYYERYVSAGNTFAQIIKQQPENVEAWYGLTQAYLLQDANSKAADTIRTAPEAIKDEPLYQVAYGTLLLHKAKKDSAANFFKSALDQTRHKDAKVLAAVAQAHIAAENGDAAYAIELLNKAMKRDKRNPQLYVLLGDAYRKSGNGSEAYKAYQQAIAKDDKWAAAYHKTGEIFLTQNNPSVYLEYFTKAVTADPQYAPAFYKLYTYEFYHDAAKAKQYYKNYVANADASIQNEYDLADLLYLNREYEKAIQKATSLLSAQGPEAQPRLYKLVSYSYAGLEDTAQAITYMKQYLEKEADSNIISKDYASLGAFYGAAEANDSLMMHYYTKAIDLEQDSAVLYDYYNKMANLAKRQEDYSAQATWLGKYYSGNNKANNLDLFNLGLAHFRAGNYQSSDSVFSIYINKYPEQGFGYYWQAKSKALLDPEMQEGLAVPVYQKLINILQQDTTASTYEKWIVEAYGYLAAYEANTKKDYAAAIAYFKKILEVNPENESAEKYIAVLENSLAGKNEN